MSLGDIKIRQDYAQLYRILHLHYSFLNYINLDFWIQQDPSQVKGGELLSSILIDGNVAVIDNLFQALKKCEIRVSIPTSYIKL